MIYVCQNCRREYRDRPEECRGCAGVRFDKLSETELAPVVQLPPMKGSASYYTGTAFPSGFSIKMPEDTLREMEEEPKSFGKSIMDMLKGTGKPRAIPRLFD